MADRPGMLLYHEQYAALSRLSDHDFRVVIDALMHYSMTGERVEPEGYMAVIYDLMADKLAHDIDEYNKRVERRKDAARKRWNGDAKQCNADDSTLARCNAVQCSALDGNYNHNHNHNHNDNHNHNSLPLPPHGDGEREEAPERPTLEQVRGCAERLRLDCDPDAFYRECEETGWTDGNGNPIRSWKIWLGNWAVKHRQTRRADDMTQPDDRVAEFERLKQKYLQEEQDDDEG